MSKVKSPVVEDLRNEIATGIIERGEAELVEFSVKALKYPDGNLKWVTTDMTNDILDKYGVVTDTHGQFVVTSRNAMATNLIQKLGNEIRESLSLTGEALAHAVKILISQRIFNLTEEAKKIISKL